MSEVNTVTPDPGGDTPSARHPRRRLVLVSTVAVSLAASGGVALAATHGGPGGGPGSGGSAPAYGTGTGQEGRRPTGNGPGRGPVDAHLGQILHGDFVVLDRSGTGTTRKRIQTGTVTAVSTTSLTVRSSDGYVGVYSLTTKSTATVGAKVTVTATLSGTKATATSVLVGAAGTAGSAKAGASAGQPPA
jgi:hypothetical protein